MYECFRWSGPSRHRNRMTAEYEPLQPYFLIELAAQAECRTFLDIGANIGVYSLFMSLVPSIQRIVAFEPSPAAAAELRANSSLNDVAIELHQQAVSSRVGNASFAVISNLSGANSLNGTSIHDTASARQIEVETISLDSLSLSGPLCLKIDVEGHELEVARGAENLLRANKAVIQIESNCPEAGRLIETLGYELLTRIGPDEYYSNIEGLSVLSVYEAASARMIEYNHSVRRVTVGRGDFLLSIGGRTAQAARRVAKKLRA
jgi:FkbM family methyltransferase